MLRSHEILEVVKNNVVSLGITCNFRRKCELEAVLRPEIIDLVAFDLASNYDIKSPGLGVKNSLFSCELIDNLTRYITYYRRLQARI